MQEMDIGSVFLSPPLLGPVPRPSLLHFSLVVPLWWLPLQLLLQAKPMETGTIYNPQPVVTSVMPLSDYAVWTDGS
jgi:hypothetical protein